MHITIDDNWPNNKTMCGRDAYDYGGFGVKHLNHSNPDEVKDSNFFPLLCGTCWKAFQSWYKAKSRAHDGVVDAVPKAQVKAGALNEEDC